MNTRLIVYSLVFSFSLGQTLLSAPSVLTGIDVLEASGFSVLRGRKIGLITNHTGKNARGERTVDVLWRASRRSGFSLVRLFSPEHGLSGTADDRVLSGKDAATGLKVISLFNKNYAPQPADLVGLDTLVFDIQDIGTRFYTYHGTMSLAMRAAARAGLRFIVLDRPNPIGGVLVQGAIPPPEKCGSLVTIHPIPTRHGMTIGELAGLYNRHFGIGCRLEVVPMQGWKRTMLWDETGLPWVNPSPNMRTLDGAILYPGPGTSETTSLSVGRWLDRASLARGLAPFEVYGANWINPQDLAGALLRGLPEEPVAAAVPRPGQTPRISLRNTSQPARPGFAVIPPANTGIRFEPVRFTVGGRNCFGVRARVEDRHHNDPVLAGLHFARVLLRLYPGRFVMTRGFANEVGDPAIIERLKQGETPESIVASWKPALDRFLAIRARYLLY